MRNGKSTAALGRQDMGSLGTFTTVTKSKRHDYKLSPFIKKRICHCNNSQRNSNLMLFVVVSEIGQPRTNVSFLLNSLFSQSLTADSPGRQRASEDHATWTEIIYFISTSSECAMRPLKPGLGQSVSHHLGTREYSLRDILLISFKSH